MRFNSFIQLCCLTFRWWPLFLMMEVRQFPVYKCHNLRKKSSWFIYSGRRVINILARVCEGSRETGSLVFRARELHTSYVSADLRVLLEFLEPWGVFSAEKITGFSSALFSKDAVKSDHNDSISTVSALLHSENCILSSKCECFLFPRGQRFLSILTVSRPFTTQFCPPHSL